MSHFTETRTARKPQGLCENCRQSIKPGDRYDRFTATPFDEIWTSEHWTHLVAHHPYGSCVQTEVFAQ